MARDMPSTRSPDDFSRRSLLRTVAALGTASVGSGVHSRVAATGDDSAQTDDTDPDQTQIEDWYDLDAVRDDVDGEYVLVNDLDSATAGYDEHVGNPDEGWEPIDGAEGGFSGTFDGQGHEIADLEINRPGPQNPPKPIAALFERLVDSGTIEEVSIVNCDVTGGSAAGALVGRNENGTVSNCFASGTVSGDSNVGGLVGVGSDMRDCAAAVDVTGDSYVGGLIGALDSVSSSVRVENSHYNVDAVEINGENALTIGGLFDDQYTDWKSNKELQVSDYPSLEVVDGRIEITSVQGVRDALGFIQEPANSWRLASDLDLSTATHDLYLPYVAGDFDGNGQTVTVAIDKPDTDQVGFVGVNDGGEVTNLTVTGPVTGLDGVGGVVGTNRGTVSNCSSSSDVHGSAAGSLVGYNFDGTVSDCSASGNVTGGGFIGGLVGGNENGTVSNCSASGDVSEGFIAGGLVGSNRGGTVNECSASGNVSGTTAIGGLVGNNYTGTVSGCSASGNVSGNRLVGGLIGTESGHVENSHYNVDAVEINGENVLTIGGLFDDQYTDWKSDKELQVSDYPSLEVVDGRIEITSVQGVRDALGFVQDPANSWRLASDLDLRSASLDLHFPYFAGDFDGNGQTVTVAIDKPRTNAVGFVGVNAGGRISNLTVTGTVTGFGRVGAIVGTNRGRVSECSASGDVSGDGWIDGGVGGLVGKNYGTVSECSASSNVNGDESVGGLVGVSAGSVNRSYATGTVTSDIVAGGLVGTNYSAVTRSFATGAVSSSGAAGGLVGVNDSDGTVDNSYWNTESTGQDDGIGDGPGDATGLQAAEMRGSAAKTNMAALDFADTWRVVTEPPEYPALAWEPSRVDPTAYRVGDADTDGEREIVDAVLIQQHLAGLFPDPFQPSLADVDRDGEITIVDAVLIQQHLAGLRADRYVEVSDVTPNADTIAVQLSNTGGLGAWDEAQLWIAAADSEQAALLDGYRPDDPLGPEQLADTVRTATFDLTHSGGQTSIEFDVSDLSPGTYRGLVYTGDDTETFRFQTQ